MAVPPELDLIEILVAEDEPLWYAALQVGSIETARCSVAALLKTGDIVLLRDGAVTEPWQWREILADIASWERAQPKEQSALWLHLTEKGHERYQREWRF
jgi:hypothetical protein